MMAGLHPCPCVLFYSPVILRAQRLAGPFGFLEDAPGSAPTATLTALDVLKKRGAPGGPVATTGLWARVEQLEEKLATQAREVQRLEAQNAQLLDEVRSADAQYAASGRGVCTVKMGGPALS